MSTPTTPALPPPAADATRIPTAAYVRRVTADISGEREGRGRWWLLVEVWAVVLYVATGFGVVLGIAWSLGLGLEGLDPGIAVGGAGATGTRTAAVALGVLGVTGALAATTARLGPVGVGGGGATWWLPLPVDRTGLLRPDALRWPALGAGAGAGGALFLPVVLGLPLSVPVLAAWTAVGGACGGVATAGVLAAQVARPRLHRRLALVGDLVLVGAVLGVSVLVERGTRPAGSAATGGVALEPGPLLGAAAVVAAGAVVLTVTSARRVGTIPGPRLREHGAASDRALAALLSLDLRELSAALSDGPTRTRHRSVRRVVRGARRAVVQTDLLVLRRSPRLLVQVTVAVLLGVTLSRVPALASGPGLYVLLLVTGLWTARAAAVGARRADLVPALDRALPLSQRQVRVARGLVPLLAATAWAAVLLVARTTWSDDGAAAALVPWLAVGPAWAAILAAGAVRAAYRPPFRVRASSAVTTPMGGRPETAGLERGLDVVLVGTLPTLLALAVDAWSPVVVGLQAAFAVAVVLGVRASDPDAAGWTRAERRELAARSRR